MRALLRAAAVAVASTALVAGTATMASAAPGDTAAVTIAPTVLNNYKGSTTKTIPATVATSRPNLSIKANVHVNGVLVATGVPVSSYGFTYQQAWGAGVVRLTNFTDYRNLPIAGASNAVNVRYGIKSGDGAQIRKVGKKLTFKVKLRYINARGNQVGIRKATLQAKKGSKWRTVKNLKLKKNGTVTYKRSDKKKRNYRLVVKTTGTYAGGVYKTSRKI